MIKINLVGEGKKVVAAKPKGGGRGLPSFSGLGGGGNLANVCLTAVSAAILLVGLGWWGLQYRTTKKNEAKITEAKRRVDELQEILQQVEEAKRKKELLEQKIQVITDLKNGQTGPVQIMDEISLGLPELLWLDRLDLQNGQVNLTGKSFSWNAVANLAENVSRVEAFQEPVGPRVSQSGQVFNFSLSFRFDPSVISSVRPEDGTEEDALDEEFPMEDVSGELGAGG